MKSLSRDVWGAGSSNGGGGVKTSYLGRRTQPLPPCPPRALSSQIMSRPEDEASLVPLLSCVSCVMSRVSCVGGWCGREREGGGGQG